MGTPEPDVEAAEWDEEVVLRVTMRVRVRPNPDLYEGLLGRTPVGLATTALVTGLDNPESIDGYADLLGSVDLVDVTED